MSEDAKGQRLSLGQTSMTTRGEFYNIWVDFLPWKHHKVQKLINFLGEGIEKIFFVKKIRVLKART
jgi:hypothetical protein